MSITESLLLSLDIYSTFKKKIIKNCYIKISFMILLCFFENFLIHSMYRKLKETTIK